MQEQARFGSPFIQGAACRVARTSGRKLAPQLRVPLDLHLRRDAREGHASWIPSGPPAETKKMAGQKRRTRRRWPPNRSRRVSTLGLFSADARGEHLLLHLRDQPPCQRHLLGPFLPRSSSKALCSTLPVVDARLQATVKLKSLVGPRPLGAPSLPVRPARRWSIAVPQLKPSCYYWCSGILDGPKLAKLIP